MSEDKKRIPVKIIWEDGRILVGLWIGTTERSFCVLIPDTDIFIGLDSQVPIKSKNICEDGVYEIRLAI